jgi:hypothetical protein
MTLFIALLDGRIIYLSPPEILNQKLKRKPLHASDWQPEGSLLYDFETMT